MTKKDLTVFIGRFSPFHNGHAAVLDRALKTSKAVLVLIGSSDQAPTTKNPFTFETRAQMIQDYLIASGNKTPCAIKPLHDHPYNDNEWIRGVQNAVETTKVEYVPVFGDNPQVYLTGADRDDSTWYLNAFGSYFNLDIVDDHPVGLELSATQIRTLMFKNYNVAPFDTENQLAKVVPQSTLKHLHRFAYTATFGALVQEYNFFQKYAEAWSKAPYAPTFVTTDACVIQSGHVLVNIRDNFPGKGLMALPGGFLEQDEKLIDGCIRELIEETNIGLSKAQLYGSIQDKEIFDKPDRSLRGRTITTCFLLKLDDSKPLPKVKPQVGEVRKCSWVPIAEALDSRDKWFEDHHSILTTMLGRIRK
jgi:bifunctional NMN adenylyltransferase/nudix hydrolase